MKGYKAFWEGMVCRGKQYTENTVFEEEKAEICKSGMHFCEKPLDVLEYYPLVNEKGEITEFAEVEALDECLTNAKIGSSGYSAKIGSSGDSAQIGSSGDYAQIGSSGYSAQIGSSGDYAQIGSSGYSAKIGSSGDYAQIDSTGEDSVICCAGHNSKVKAKKGSWITLAEWKRDDKKGRWIPVCVKTEFVDGERIKADTFYKLVNGEFIEIKE